MLNNIRLLNTLLSFVILATIAILSSCSNDTNELPEPPKVVEDYNETHTMLMYMIADNNLSSFITQDLAECCQGYLNAPGSMNLQVYIDSQTNNNGLPMLMNVRRNIRRDSLIYDTLRIWKPDHNSADPAMMSQIIKEAFSGKFDTPVKGIVLSSHGYAWTPAKSFKAAGARGMAQTDTTDPLWIGQDNTPTTNYMEIWDLHDAIKQSGVKLTHIMFDACFMSNAETAYELRDCAHYQIASACEIPGDGFPYHKVLPELSKLKSESELKDVLSKVIDVYGNEYSDKNNETGEMCLLDLTCMDDIAAAYKKVRKGNTLNEDIVISFDSLSTSGKPLAKMQSYGRFYVGAYYDYFDLAECAAKLGDNGSFAALIQKAVVRETHASMFRMCPEYMAGGDRRKGYDTESFPFSSCSGVSVSLPEIFHCCDKYNRESSHPTYEQMVSAYSKTQWGKYMEQ